LRLLLSLLLSQPLLIGDLAAHHCLSLLLT
jgi:hypothetical protein